ncbi:S-adenosyl-L-methionine-dependent methyltransferase [Polyplosphaeria fusca]|uniref:S-adenosyl-L-methionine-dependent methyltransferase n=1 Tax=Polyplosphaeria fusca TaxID=682080 RepID=A0A9P4R4E7_9PLEO|nr:S-adenosyl-L-methionine-dependent methyltransferase [Polyplosphaeria fusca]
MPPFKPKQHTTLTPTQLSELQGDGSQQALRKALTLIPPLTPASVIHDNACGAGALTSVILTNTSPPPPVGLHIHATDFNAAFVDGVAAQIHQNGWPATAAVMDARKLDFPDATFSHSFTAFAFHCMPGADEAAREIFRTVVPGGVAVVSTWTELPHVAAFQAAHRTTRGAGTGMPVLLPEEELMAGAELVELLRGGGFERVETHEVVVRIGLGELGEWAQLGWSYLGRMGGEEEWFESDEERWDEAVRTVVREMQKGGRLEKGEDGRDYMRAVGCIAVATR